MPRKLAAAPPAPADEDSVVDSSGEDDDSDGGAAIEGAPSGAGLDEERLRSKRLELEVKEERSFCKIKESKRELSPLVIVPGMRIENACAFTQWKKKLKSWQKLTNINWIFDRPDLHDKYPSLFKRADEALYIGIEAAITDRVVLNLIQADEMGESGIKVFAALSSYFDLARDEPAIDRLHDRLVNCPILKGETVETWLVRRAEIEELLATTNRKKSKEELLALLRESIPDCLKKVNKQLMISHGVIANDRALYENALLNYARMVGYPHGDGKAAPTKDRYNKPVQSALATVPVSSVSENKQSIEGVEFTSAQLAVVSQLLAPKKPQKSSSDRSDLLCTHCKRKGHDAGSCWKLHPERKPDWLKKLDEKKKEKEKQASVPALSVAEAREALSRAETLANPPSTKQVKWSIQGIASSLPPSGFSPSPAICESLASASGLGILNDLDHWIVDSGSVRHVTPRRSAFRTITPPASPEFLVVADGRTFPVEGFGSVSLEVLDSAGELGSITLSDVAWVPSFAFNLLSSSSLQAVGFDILFYSDCSPLSSSISRLVGDLDVSIPLSRWNSLWTLRALPPSLSLACVPIPPDVAHARLGHKSLKALTRLSEVADGLSLSSERLSRGACEACALDQHRQPISKSPSPSRASVPNFRVFSDMTGPFTEEEDGERILFLPNHHPYIINFIDDCTRHAVWFSAPKKDSASFLHCLERYMTMVGSAMVVLRTDDARELSSDACKRFYAAHRIRRELTTPGSPQFNGVAEANLRVVMEMGRRLRLHSGLPPEFGYLSALVGLFVHNNCVTRSLPSGITPFQAWTGRRSDLSALRVFGCRCWTHLNRSHLSKMDSRAREGIYVGFAPDSKGFLVFIPDTGQFISSRNVIFDELAFPARADPSRVLVEEAFEVDPVPFPPLSSSLPQVVSTGDDGCAPSPSPPMDYQEIEVHIPSCPPLSDLDMQLLDECRASSTSLSPPPTRPSDIVPIPVDDQLEIGDDFAPPEALLDSHERTAYGPALRRSERGAAPNPRFANLVTKSVGGGSSIVMALVTLCSLLFVSLSAIETAINQVKGHKLFEPKTYKEAIECNDAAEWVESMKREFSHSTRKQHLPGCLPQRNPKGAKAP